MVALGFAMLAAVRAGILEHASRATSTRSPGCCSWALWMLPAPWIASELGWFVAEYGRQPWTIYGVLPTHLTVSTLSVEQPVRLAGRLHRLLHRAAGRRDVPDGEVRAPGPGQPGHRPLFQAKRAHRLTRLRSRRMLDYPTLKVIWWLLVGVLLVGFAIMDGHDMGVGTLLPFVGRERHWSAASSSTPSARTGTATRSGSSPAAAPSLRRGRWCTRRRSAGSTGPCWRCCGRCSSARSVSTIAARSTIRAGAALGTGACSLVARCRR